jgi:beta-glucosidase
MDMADGDYGKTLSGLVQSGKVPTSVLDEAVRRVLRIKFRAGLFDHPYTDEQRASIDIFSPGNEEVARKMAQESIVLLKNKNNILPLSKSVKTLAVIGFLANDKANQLGPWAAAGRAEDAVTPLEGIKAKIPGAAILYAIGAEIPSFEKTGTNTITAAPAPSTATGAAGKNQASGPASIEDAVKAAKRADAIVLFLGELAEMTGEASARATLTLPGKQQELLEAVAATGKPVVLVLESGRPLEIQWAKDHVPAIIQAWFPGVQAGNAIADVLFGDVNPSAKLPLSWPVSVGQIPVYYNHKPTGRPTSPDRWHTGYVDETKEPLFPFGYGLNYTTFKYDSLRVHTPTLAANGTLLRVSADVANTGPRAGTEVVELYVRDRVAPTSRPVRELKGFSRVALAAGEHKTVEFTVNANDLGSYDPDMKWIVPPGTYDVWVGSSSDEGLHGTFEVTH